MFEVKLVRADEVAKLFHTTQQKIKAAILNGTLPIGFVAEGEVDRIYIVEKRLAAYLNAEDLQGRVLLQPQKGAGTYDEVLTPHIRSAGADG